MKFLILFFQLKIILTILSSETRVKIPSELEAVILNLLHESFIPINSH